MAVVLIKHSYMRWYEPKCEKMNSEVEQTEKSWEQSRLKHTKEKVFMSFCYLLLHRCWLKMNTVGLSVSNQSEVLC